jgi:hypothetical protein
MKFNYLGTIMTVGTLMNFGCLLTVIYQSAKS